MITRKHQISQSPKNSVEQTFMNAFDLYIEGIKLEYKGYIEIQWRRGKKMIQTLKHQCDGKGAVIKETLTLNITLTFRNNRTIEKNTVLTIVGANGETMDEVTLPVHRWTSQYSSLEIPIGHGVLKTKARKRQLMVLKVPTGLASPYTHSIINSDDEQYSQFIEEEINVRMMMSETKNNRIQVDSQRDETTKLRKELEDTLYVNNKLKNDRSVLLSRNLQLQSQLSYLKTQIREQFQRMQKNYQGKLQMRESIYEDEINNIITAFNSNSDYNVLILRHAIEGNRKLEDELRRVKTETAEAGKELEGYQGRILEIQSEKEMLRRSIKEYSDRFEAEKSSLTQKLTDLQSQLQTQQKTNSEHSLTITNLKTTISQLQTSISNLETEKLSAQTELQFAKDEIDALTKHIEELEAELDESKNQLEFTQQAYKKQKETGETSQEVYRAHIKRLEEIIGQFQAKEMMAKQDEAGKEQSYVKDNDNLKKQIMRLRGELQRSNEEAKSIRKLLEDEKESSKRLTSELQRSIEALKLEIHTKTQQRQLEHSRSVQNSQAINEKQSQIEKLISELHGGRQQLEKLTKQIKDLSEQNQKLREQLQFINENAIKIEEHDQLQNRVVELEGKLAEYEMHYQNVDFPSFEKEMAHQESDKKEKEKGKDGKKSGPNSNAKIQQDFENISFEVGAHNLNTSINDKFKSLEQELKGSRTKIEELIHQNELLQKRYDLLLEELEQLRNREKEILKELQMAKVTEVKVVSYCESEDEINRKLEESDSRRLLGSSKKGTKQNVSFAEESFQNKRKGEEEPLEKDPKFKKSTSMHEMHSHKSKKIKTDLSESQMVLEDERQHGSKKGLEVSIEVERQGLRGKKESQREQKLATFRNQGDKKDEIIHDQSRKRGSRGQHNIKRSSVISKMSEVRVEMMESNRQGISSKSACSNEQDRESFVSGTTLYKFQRVTHREKIKRLEQQLAEYQQYVEKSKLREIELLSEMQKANAKVADFEKELKQMEEDRHSLKASLHFQLEKKNVQKENRSAQTEEKERLSKAVEADIVLEDKEKMGLQQELAKTIKMLNEMQSQSNSRIGQHEVRYKNIVVKLEESERRAQDILKRLQERAQEIERLKKQLKSSEQREGESKNAIHGLKLEKTQTDFLLQKHEQESKRLKQRIQELEQKMKKSDVLDAFKQAQYELENSNKRVLDLNRTIYQMKLEKDTLEDEMKLIRKKNGETMKKCTELEYSIESLEKAIEEYKRKESRHRREIEDREDTIEKQRDQIKRLSDEISMLKGLNNEQMFERKKYMDEITALQNVAERKEYQILNLKKELQRFRYRLQQKQQQRSQHKLSLRRQLETLESELSQRNKQTHQLQSTIKQLTNKLEFLTTQNKRSMNQKSGLYSQKLKAYIEEIADIKKLLDDNNLENNSLKFQIKEYEEEVGGLRMQLGKLEDRMNQELAGNRELMGLLQAEHGQTEKQRERIQELEQELFNLRNQLKTLKQQQDQQKKQHQLKKQSLQTLTKQNESLLQQLNRNKVKLSEYETQLQINRNYNEKLSESDKELRNAVKELKESKRVFEEYRGKFVHTAGELDAALRSMEAKWKEKYELMQGKLEEEYNANLATSKKHLQAEILQLLAEVSQTRTDSQKKSELISQLQFKMTKLEVLPLKLAEYEKLYNDKMEEAKRYKGIEQGSKEMRERVERLEEALARATSGKGEAEQELGQFKNRVKAMQVTIDESSGLLKNAERENARLGRQIAQIQHQESAYKQQIQNLLTSIKALEQQKSSLLQKSEQNRKEYHTKISKLQQKLQQMSSTVQEHEQALSTHYEKNLEEIKAQLQKMYYEMQTKDKVITESEDVINRLEGESQGLRREIGRMKEKELSDGEIFEMEFNKLKNKMNQKQKEYRNNVSELEMQVQQMSKQLTNIKLKNMSQTNIPARDETLTGSSLNIMRLEEKLKQRDNKLEELKQNVFVLEETIIKLKKKEAMFAEYSEKYGKLERDNGELGIEVRRLEEELRKMQAKEINAGNALKSQLNNLKSMNERLKLSLEEKELELQSARYELQTLKQLYGELQKELDKRQINLKEKAETESRFNMQIQKKIEIIETLEENLEQVSRKEKSLTEELAKRNQVIENLEEKVLSYEKMESKLKSTAKLNSEGQHYKNQIKRLSEQNEVLQKSNRKLREEIQILEKDNYQTKTKLSLNQSSIDNLNLTLEEMSSKCRDLELSYKKFQDINEACYKIFRVGLDEAIFHGYISQKMDQREMEINRLIEQVEQLKFLNERKLLDFDQLKKQNYELQLRLQDAEFVEDQVEELRSICDKLEQEKKDAIFRQEVLKVQVQSILSNSSNEARERLDKIKIEEMMRKFTNNTNVNRISFS